MHFLHDKKIMGFTTSKVSRCYSHADSHADSHVDSHADSHVDTHSQMMGTLGVGSLLVKDLGKRPFYLQVFDIRIAL